MGLWDPQNRDLRRKLPPETMFSFGLLSPPLWWGGVNQRTIYICSDHICACRGVNSGLHDSPYIRKLSLDHDSGKKSRGCHSVFQKYSTLLVFTSVTHASPSLTASLAIIVPTRSPFFEISKSQKSEHATESALAVPISLSRSARLIKKRERLSWSLNCIPRKLGQPRTPYLPSYYL